MKDLSPVNLKKHAAAIHCSGELSLVERKLSNILLLNAYEDLLEKDVHSIPTKHLLIMLGWSESNNVEGLKSTLKGLMSTIIEFNLIGSRGEIWQAMSLISSATISDGVCRYTYTKELAAKFYKPEIFAVINIAVQKLFKSNYALTLYENCVRFINVGSTGWWDLNTFRKIMGATSDTYDEFKRLSSFVIKKALNEINTVSDIRLKVEYKKENKKVVALRFLITLSPQQILIDGDSKKINMDKLNAGLKNSELFRRLRAHGIGERLALSWMVEEPELAAKAVDYTEIMDNKGLIKGNTGGYIRRLIESGAQLDPAEYQLQKKEKLTEKTQESIRLKEKNEMDKRLKEYQTVKYQKARKIIPLEKLEQLKNEFLMSNKDNALIKTVFDYEKGKFFDKATQLTFLPWLKKAITPGFNKEEFEIWLGQKL